MGDLGSDLDSMIILIRDEYTLLREIAPQHDELKYLCDVDMSGFSWNKKNWNEFIGKYAPSEKTTMFDAKLNYYKGLKNARIGSYQSAVAQAHDALKKTNPAHRLLSLIDPKTLNDLTEDNWNEKFKPVLDVYFSEARSTIHAVNAYIRELKREATQPQLF
jgi:hypothetical protein